LEDLKDFSPTGDSIKTNEAMKKEYMKPAMSVVELKHRSHILCGSNYDSKSAPVDTYDAPEDAITTKGGVW
jgi:hypothetical protein